MNPYSDWMKAFCTIRMMNDKNGRPDARALLAQRKRVVALERGDSRRKNERKLAAALKPESVRRKNEKRLANVLEPESRKRRNERRLALALL